MDNTNAPIIAEPVVVEHKPMYRHAACGTLSNPGPFTPDSPEMPCKYCGMTPPQKDFIWE